MEPNCTGLIDFRNITAEDGRVARIDYLFVAVGNASELFVVRNSPLEEMDAKLLFRR